MIYYDKLCPACFIINNGYMHENKMYEPGLKSIFVARLCVVLNFCILINNELILVQKFKTP
jgi:hypothetical protein